jgi:hypothetical protein
MERHEILEAMSELKLHGMHASFDEIAGKGLARLSITHNSDLLEGGRSTGNLESKESLVIHC